MTYALVGLIAAVLVFHVVCSRGWERERARFVHALLSRGPADFAALERLTEPAKRGWVPKRKVRDNDGEAISDIDTPIGVG